MLNRIRQDDGVTLIIVAASLIMLMGMAAIVVDGGFGFTERRQAQSGADFAALAALQYARSCQQAGGCNLSNAAEYGFTEVERVVDANLPGRSLDWAACVDPTPLSIPANTTNCVSFNSNFTHSRVMIPADTFDTFFGRVIGSSTLTVSAVAEALQINDLSAVIVPFVPNGSGAEICLFTNQAPQAAEPCDGPDTGNFGYLDLALYGNDELNTPETCSQGNQNAKVALNISKGSDHILTVYSGGTPVNDHDACPNRVEDITEVVYEQGSPTGAVTDGLFAGVSANIQGNPVSGPARLRCDSGTCVTIRGRSLDNRPLWSYLNGACPGVSDHASMETCLNSWTAADGSIFTGALGDNLRFVAVPDVSPSPTGGPKDRLIDDFLPVWLETIYMGNCNSSGPTCPTIFSPTGSSTPPGNCPNPIDPVVDFNCGWTSNAGQNSIQQLTAFRLQRGMLPLSLQETFPGQSGVREFSLFK